MYFALSCLACKATARCGQSRHFEKLSQLVSATKPTIPHHRSQQLHETPRTRKTRNIALCSPCSRQKLGPPFSGEMTSCCCWPVALGGAVGCCRGLYVSPQRCCSLHYKYDACTTTTAAVVNLEPYYSIYSVSIVETPNNVVCATIE